MKGELKIEVIEIDYKSKDYPDNFKKIKNPPEKIYAIGNLKLLNTYSISIIGSRACSIEGINIAKQFAKDLSEQGLTITSGMALGIYSAAHIGTLEKNGKTIAVLGSGLNNIFPKENIKLFHDIVNNGGLVISEYPLSAKADSKKFLERNRLVSALSIGVLIVEAAHRSGTSVTCKLAFEQGKKVFCIPHGLGDKHGVGTNNLLKRGAKIVTSARDIIESFDFLEYKDNLENQDSEEIDKMNNKYKEKINSKKINKKFEDVYNCLIGPPLKINQICNILNKPVNEVNNALFMLELDGLVEKTKYGYQIKE